MKTKMLMMSFLVFILGSSINENNAYEKKVLVTGKIITQGLLIPNGHLEFYVHHYNGKIQSLNLRGGALFISRTKTIKIKDIKKDSLTSISLHESLDQIFSIDISSAFTKDGGTLYSSITDNNLHTDYYQIDIIKKDNTFKTYHQKLYDSNNISKKEFNKIIIELDKSGDIKKYNILFE